MVLSSVRLRVAVRSVLFLIAITVALMAFIGESGLHAVQLLAYDFSYGPLGQRPPNVLAVHLFASIAPKWPDFTAKGTLSLVQYRRPTGIMYYYRQAIAPNLPVSPMVQDFPDVSGITYVDLDIMEGSVFPVRDLRVISEWPCLRSVSIWWGYRDYRQHICEGENLPKMRQIVSDWCRDLDASGGALPYEEHQAYRRRLDECIIPVKGTFPWDPPSKPPSKAMAD